MRTFAEFVLHDLRSALRTRRLIALVALYIVIGLVAALAITSAVRGLQQEVLQALTAQGVPADVVHERVLEASEERALSLIEGFDDDFSRYAEPLRRSVITFVFFWMSLVACPWLVALTCFDLFSSDLRQRTFTFYNLRVSRRTLVTARLCSQILLVLVVLSLSATVFVATAAIRLPFTGNAILLQGLLWCLALLAVYASVWVALAGVASVSTSSPFRALGQLVLFLVVLGALRLAEPAASYFGIPPLAWLAWLSPGVHRTGLWFEVSGPWFAAVAALLGFFLVFGGLTAALFQRKEL